MKLPRKVFLDVAAVLVAAWAPSATAQGVITTVAGTDFILPASRFPALAAPLGRVRDTCVDASGTIYVSDEQNHVVARISSDGFLDVIAGNGLSGFSGDGGRAINAAFRAPLGLALDSAGNLYIADQDDNRVRKVSPGGTVTTVAGTGVASFSGDGGSAANAAINAPRGLAVDHAGNLYIADSGNNRIRQVTPSGIITTYPAGSGLITPQAVAVDQNGIVFVADTGGVRRVASNGSVQFISQNVYLASGLAVDASGNVYVSDSVRQQIFRLTAADPVLIAGQFYVTGFSGDGGPATTAQLRNPGGMAVDSKGNVYIADRDNYRIRKVDTSGTITTIAGNGQYRFSGDGGPAASANLNQPVALSFDSAGNLLVADLLNSRIRKIDTGGLIQTVAGNGTFGYSGDGGTAVSAALNLPEGVAGGINGQFYIADQFNNRVRQVTPDGRITTLAGGGPALGDGGPPSQAQLSFPWSVAADFQGRVYIADALNNRIRRVSADGLTITTIAGSGLPGFSGDGGAAVNARLSAPRAVAVDSLGRVYFSDSGNNRVRVIGIDGTIQTLAGGGSALGDNGPAKNAALNNPRGIALDAGGNLYIADSFNNRIRMVGQDGNITTVAGTGVVGFAGDGDLAVRAQISTPQGVAVDASGNLYVADVDNNRIRVVLKAQPAMVVSASQLSFNGVGGGAPSPNQSINISASVPGIGFTATVSAGNSSWLSVSTPSGATPRVMDVIADPATLQAGTYQATITINAPNATPPTTVVNVTFTVAAGTGPSLLLDKGTLSFIFPRVGKPSSQNLVVSNVGSGTLNFTTSAHTTTGGSWLSVSPSTGAATPTIPATLTVTADPTGLPPGTYNGSLTINNTSLPVVMTIGALDQAILLSQQGLTFTGVESGGTVPPQTFSVLNIGTAPVSWTISTSTLAGGNAWLQVAPSTGTTNTGPQSATTVAVGVNVSGLVAGDYYGLVRIDAPGATATPQVITVFMKVLAAGTDLAAVAQPGVLLFTTTTSAGSPGSQVVSIYNLTSRPKSFHAVSDSASIATLPNDATVNPQQPIPIVVQPFTEGLAPGVYSNTLTLQFTDGRVSRVNVKTIVTNGGPGGVNAIGLRSSGRRGPLSDGPCSPTKLLPALVTLPDSFEVSAGWPVALSATVKDDCGGPHDSGSVTVSFSSADPPVTLQSIGGGRWEGTWPNRTAAGSKVTLKVHAENPQSKIIGDEQVSGALQSQQQPPMFDVAGVVPIFGGPSYLPVAPGGVISIYGDRLAESSLQGTSSPLSSQLVDTQVFLAGVKLPLYYVSQTQINAIVPFEINVNTQLQLLVQRGLTYSIPVRVNVAPAQPSMLGTVTDYPTSGDAPYNVSASLPAQVGDTVVIYCTGLGPVTPKVADGAASGPSNSTVDNAVQLMIGNQPAKVVFAGLAPGFPGLYQINAVIAAGTPGGTAVPVTMTVAGQTSSPVPLAIH
jgi:uncharacterized protein (TIGR03437 family)